MNLSKIIIKIIIVALFVFSVVQVHYDKACRSIGWDKGAILTVEGVFCERTVQSSYETPYLPINGATLEYNYKNNPISPIVPPPFDGVDA